MSNTMREWPEPAADVAQIARAIVVGMDQAGEHVRIRCPGDAEEIVCDILLPPGGGLAVFAEGDVVLIWRPGREGDLPVVLGRIGAQRTAKSQETPDELMIEARHCLTLRVGSGSMTIREDGKILIKGKDLVSHAQRLNRIKGGAVQIN